LKSECTIASPEKNSVRNDELRVCLVSHSAGLGGAERALLEMALALRMKSIESFVILPSKGPLLEQLAASRIPCAIIRNYWWVGKRRILWRNFGGILLSMFAAIPLIRLIHRWKIDLVCSNSIVVFVGALAARLANKPHVWFVHEFLSDKYGIEPCLPLQVTMWLVSALSRVIVTNSMTTREKYAQLMPRSEVRVAYQAVLPLPSGSSNLQDPVPFSSGAAFRCASVGSLNPIKGHPDAIRAVGCLNRRGIAAELAIVGDGPDKASLEALVQNEDLRGKVLFTGYLPNPVAIMQAADAILVCSRGEAFGRVAVEAMRLGKPLVAAASGATPELITDRFNGLLYKSGNAEELAEKLLLLLKSPSLGNELAQNGQRRANCFSLERYGTAVLRCFEQALRSNA
jgi:glycosyltransferase involved in cell wall biosynthesis